MYFTDNPDKSDSKSNSSDDGLDRPDAQGGYITDDLVIGDYKLPQFRMGLAKKATAFAGKMGLGTVKNEDNFDQNSTILDAMVANGLIQRRTYSIWLNTVESDKGGIVFGGVDTAKFEGDLKWIDMTAPPFVALVGMSLTAGQISIASTGFNKRQADAVTEDEASATESADTSDDDDLEEALNEALNFDPIGVIFDSSAAVSSIDRLRFEAYADAFGASKTDDLILYIVPCSFDEEGSIGFKFGNLDDGPIIEVPFSEFMIPIPDWMQPESGPLTFDDETPACWFGLSPLDSNDTMILGQTFLRSAYVDFDLEAKTVGLASARWNATDSNIQETSGDGSAITVSAASVGATASMVQEQNQPGRINATNVGKPSSAASALKSGFASSTDSSPSKTSSASAAAAPSATEQSTIHLAMFVLCGSVFLIAAMFL